MSVCRTVSEIFSVK